MPWFKKKEFNVINKTSVCKIFFFGFQKNHNFSHDVLRRKKCKAWFLKHYMLVYFSPFTKNVDQKRTNDKRKFITLHIGWIIIYI